MPAFHDWRVAYLGQDGHVHIATVDGQTDLKGPEFPYLGGYQAGLGFWSGGVSPDGHLLAFSIDQLAIVNLAAPHSPHLTATTAGGLVYDMAWSPDSARLAVSGGSGVDIVTASGGGPPELLANAKTSLSHPLVGWIDAAHVAYISDTQMGQQSPSGLWLDAVDVTTDQVRRIAALPAVLSVAGNVPDITLSPDGRQAVLSNVAWRDYAFTPTVDVLDTVTGQITPLPTISRVTNASWAGRPAWKPGTETLAVTTYVSSAASPDGLAPRIWSVDLAHDTADLLPGGDGWYALGWAPDDGPLVIGTTGGTSGFKLGQEPHKLAAVTYLSADQTQILALTETAITFPFIGFVRTT